MNSKQKTELLKIRTATTIVMDTLSFVWENFKPLFSGLFYICSPILLLAAISSFLFFKTYFSFIFKSSFESAIGQMSSDSTLNELYILIPYLILMLLGIYASMCFVISVSYSFVKLYHQDEEINTSTLWNTSKKYIVKIIGAQLIFLLVFLLGYIICLVPVLLFFMDTAAGLIGIFITFLLFIGFIILIFYLYVKLAFHMHYIVVEDKGIIESFKLSYRFSKGVFGKVFLTAFLLSLIVSICGNIFQAPGMVIMYGGIILGITRGEDYSLTMSIGTTLVSVGMAVAYILYSVIYIGISITYYSVTEERFGIKAKESIENIGKREDWE